MSEERFSRPEPENFQHQAEHTHPRRKMSVFGYLAVLFAVAFLLLLMAFFQQQRASDETADALQKSQSTIESIQQLLEESNGLREEKDKLTEQVSDLQGQVAELDAARRLQNMNLEEMTAQLESQENALKALDYFWQIDEAYALKRYNLCRQLMEEMGDLWEYLPDWKATENERFTPLKRYEEIKKALG